MITRLSYSIALTVLLIVVVAATAQNSGQSPQSLLHPRLASQLRSVCGVPTESRASCMVQTASGTRQARFVSQPPRSALTPAMLKSIYQLPETTPASKSQTVAVIEARDDPYAEADLNVYSREFGLPACTSANRCLTKVNQYGRRDHLPPMDNIWGSETALDLAMVHAICPDCRILLVEANDDRIQNLGSAVDTAVRLGASEVSNSYGVLESEGWYFPRQARTIALNRHYDHPGVVITASTGDSGYLGQQLTDTLTLPSPGYPSSAPSVVAVGGTYLARSSSGGWKPSAWFSGGSGCSSLLRAPSWQLNARNYGRLKCQGFRSTADIAYAADSTAGVAVYYSHPEPHTPRGWVSMTGTSVSAPIAAAVFALAGGSHGVAYPAQTLYAHYRRTPQLFQDIRAGRNAADCGSLSCRAGRGPDGPTGLGSPIGLRAFAPIKRFRRHVRHSPGTIELSKGPGARPVIVGDTLYVNVTCFVAACRGTLAIHHGGTSPDRPPSFHTRSRRYALPKGATTRLAYLLTEKGQDEARFDLRSSRSVWFTGVTDHGVVIYVPASKISS